MSIFKRAFLYVIPKRGKIPLFAILLIMATFVLAGLFIWKAPEAAQLDLRQSLGGEFDIFADWSSSPYAVKEPVKDEVDEETGKTSSSFLVYSTVQFTPENIAAIKRGIGSSPYYRFAGVLARVSQGVWYIHSLFQPFPGEYFVKFIPGAFFER